MTYRALLIGNSVFDADAALNPLNAPVKDVARLHRALVDADTGLFSDDNVRLVTERTCDGLLDELDHFFGSGARDDLLLLYYSGHGLLDERNHLYLCGRDTRSDRLLRTAVSNVRINEFVLNSLAQRTVIVLDCCSSGMFKGGAIDDKLAGPGRYIVSSTRGRDLANDAATPTGTSLFTEHLVQGLLGAAPDTDGDGYIDLREIYDYVRNQLVATTRQVPHCRFDGDAAVSLARTRVVPAIARAPSGAMRFPSEPTFALAENTITLREIEVGDVLPPERVEIIQLGDEPLDLVARTDADWLTVSIAGDEVVVVLDPKLGRNSGKITVRDQASGSTQVLRVEARVGPSAAPTGPLPAVALEATAKGVAPEVDEPEADVSDEPQSDEPQSDEPRPDEPQSDEPQPPESTEVDTSAQPAPEPPRPGPLRARQWQAPAIYWPGLGAAILGGVFLVIAFSGTPWYRDSGTNVTVDSLHISSVELALHYAEGFFNGGGWLFVIVGTLCAVIGNVLSGRASRVLRLVAVVAGVGGIVASLTAVQQIITAARKQGVDVSGLFSDSAPGLYLMLLGFALLVASGALPRRVQKPTVPQASATDE